MANNVPVLSDGTPSTLENWRKIAVALGGDPNPATEFLDRKIAEQGKDEPVLAVESQMLNVIVSMINKPATLIDLGGERDIADVMKVIIEAFVYAADEKFMQALIAAREKTTDFVGRARLDVEFTDKVSALRVAGVLTTHEGELMKKAEEIVENNPPVMWYGLATQYATSLVTPKK